jgi:predicted ATPase
MPQLQVGKSFHFHDTSDTAGVKRLGALHDNESLRPDASNLAAFLYKLANEHAAIYERIRQVVTLAIPFFDDFVLQPRMLPTEEGQIRLLWRQKGSDYSLWPGQLSDGSIRFICLATALLQPDPPSTIIIDEPELGLHPYAITLLGSLIRSVSSRTQVIISTQSVPLLNEFSLDDLIVVEREEGASVFKRLNQDAFATWLSDYSIGELWEKNILGGRPSR